MRSFVAFAALALSAADMVSAGPCKPRPTTTAATETSAGGGADATTLPEPPLNEPIVNACEGGGMTDLTIFTTVGDVKPNGQDGFTNDGSPDTACAQLSAESTGPARKRQNAGDVAALGQSLSGLNTHTMYTVQFYYRVFTSPSETTACTLEAFIGDLRFFNTGIFANGASVSYNQVLVSTSVPATEGELNIKTTCVNGGSATVLIDSIFVSNQVTPENIDNYRLDFGDGEIREPVNHPATTVGTQLPPTTQEGVATGTEAADATSTAAGGNGNDTGNSSVQPTSAAQGEATSNPTQGNSESTETGASKPTTAAQDGEETSQPTQGSGSQSTTVVGGDSTVTTRAAGNDNDATTQTQGSGSQPTAVSQGSGSDATTVSEGSGSQPTTVTQGSGSDATTQTQGSGSDATTVSQGSGSDSTTVSEGSDSQPTTVPQGSGSDATTQTQGSGSQPTTVTEGSDATTARDDSTETKTDSSETQTSEAASEQTQSSHAETRTNTAGSDNTQTETAASQGTQSSAPASEQTQATSDSVPTTTSPSENESSQSTSAPVVDDSVTTTTAPAGTESTSAPTVDGSSQSTTAAVVDESITTTTAPAGTESTSAPVISDSSATSSSAPDETTSTSSSEATEAFVARAEPARTHCLSASNHVENGDFEGVEAEWTFTGSAAAVHDKELGPRAHTIGPYGVGFVGPDTGLFSQNIRNLDVGGRYYLSYAYFVASGEGLPDNQCTVKVILGLDEVETFDPFQDSEAWNGYRNRIFQVSPSTVDNELSFELTCTGQPNAFTLMMDDVYLVPCNE